MVKTVLFTHDDMDGAGCAIIFNLVMRSNDVDYKVIHCSNDNVNDKIKKALDDGTIDCNTVLCFGDICPSEEMAKYLNALLPGNIRVWDHHKSSSYISDAIPGAKIVTEIEPGKLESGTSLMYNFFTKVPSWDPSKYDVKLLAELSDNIRSYDTYEWKQTNNIVAQRLHALCKLIRLDGFVDEYTRRILDPLARMECNALIDPIHNRYIDTYLENEQNQIDSVSRDDVKIVTLKGYQAAVRFAGGPGVSELSDQFLRKNPDIDVFIELGIGAGYYSFRTLRDDLDLGAVFAKPLGGGGHPHAAGAPIAESIRDEVFNLFITSMAGE